MRHRMNSGFNKLLILGVLTWSCQDLVHAKRPYQTVEKPQEFFSALEDKRLSNADYPIEVELKKDGVFHYHLPTLKEGDGVGTWRYQDGHVELYAERRMFVMKMAIRSVDDGTLALEFSDRFGPKYLPVSK